MIPLGVLGSAVASSIPAADGAFSYLGTAASSAGTVTTHTLSGQSLGSPCVDRTIIVALMTQSTLSSITVGGQAVTIDANDSGSYSTRAAVGHVTLPAGTSGDVVVTLGSAHNRVVIGLWRYGGPVTVAATDVAKPVTLAVQPGDKCVATAYWASGTYSWSGATSRYQTASPTGDYGIGADYEAASGGTASMSASGTVFAMAGVAYRP